jgi:hypothetical protein
VVLSDIILGQPFGPFFSQQQQFQTFIRHMRAM